MNRTRQAKRLRRSLSADSELQIEDNDTVVQDTPPSPELVSILADLRSNNERPSVQEEFTTPRTSNVDITNAKNKDDPAELKKLTVKLDRLTNKRSRYESHHEFLDRCIQAKLVPNALQFELEPTIGNHDDAFLEQWYTAQKEFQLKLMKLTSEFCQKTQDAVSEEIKEAENVIKKETSTTLHRLRRRLL